MSENEFVASVEEHVRNLFKEKFHADHIYHNITHTTDVVKAATKIAKSEELSDKDTETLIIAAWFHDVGYAESFDNHEELSCQIAEEFLTKNNFANERVDQIKSAIMATKVPQTPKNIIDEILCDADLKHLGGSDFFEKSDLFRVEMERRTGNTMNDYEWLKGTVDFATQHKFFTRFAREKYLPQKEVNLVKLQKQLRKKLKKYEEDALKDEKLAFEKEKLAKRREQEKKADRGIETMFRNVMRTHIDLSSMADNKANIMISVNTLLLGAIATLLARKLDANPHLVVPTIVLSVVSLATLIYAILATRPSITSGTFTHEDIRNKKTNLLFFGNFYNMELKDFSWGMNEMMNDRDYLYGSMIKDFYFLGQVLGKKYKLLRICYSIFMYGMVISILLFIVFILMYPEGAADFGPLIE
jgi:predicted metal-dependent HD superfamily phosphohydrolase/protein-S-isoprenylcysteine O-methyltransferase Ste14